MSKNKIRTLLLSDALLKNLNILHDNYYVDKSTFIRVAIYHGLENIKNGHFPYRNIHIRELYRKKYILPKFSNDCNKKAPRSGALFHFCQIFHLSVL